MLAICQGVLHYVATAPEDPEVIEPLLLLVKFGKWVPWRPNYRSWRHCCWKIHANAGGKQYILCGFAICYRLLEYQENYPFVLCMKITEFFVSFFFLFKKCCTNHTTRNIWVIHIFCLCNTNLKWVALFFYAADKVKP